MVHTVKMRHHAEFGEDRSDRYRDHRWQWVSGLWIKWVNEYG